LASLSPISVPAVQTIKRDADSRRAPRRSFPFSISHISCFWDSDCGFHRHFSLPSRGIGFARHRLSRACVLFASSVFDLEDTASIVDPRCLSVLAAIPGLHIACLMLWRIRLSATDLALASIQSIILVFAFWIRASAIWVVVGLTLVAFFIVFQGLFDMAPPSAMPRHSRCRRQSRISALRGGARYFEWLGFRLATPGCPSGDNGGAVLIPSP
jgi:hypothetical protein